MVVSTDGLITSSSGFGKNPSTMIRSSNGASETTSRRFRSRMPTTAGTTGPVIVRWYIHRM
jgi:hypothetical protein